MSRKHTITAALLSATALCGASATAEDGLTIEALHSLDRVGAPVVSPAGDKVAYVVREADLEANGGDRNIFILNLADGAAPMRLTDAPEGDGAPQWSPDGETVFFLSSRSGSNQVWRQSASGGRARQVSDYPIDLATFRLSPDGARIVFAAAVYPDCDALQCTADRLKEVGAKEETGMLYDSLFVRHWDSYKDGRRSMLFPRQSMRVARKRARRRC